MSFEVIPAIDLLDGECVRLARGRRMAKTVYSQNPVAVARAFEAEGAKRLHLIDLNAAFGDSEKNNETVKKIIRGTTLKVQVGGGVRTVARARELFEAGADAVIIGSVASGNVSEAEKIVGCGKVFAAIDARNGIAVKNGWACATGKTVADFARELETLGASAVILTDTERDGMLCGPNLPLAKQLVGLVKKPVYASGGISSLNDLKKVRETGAAGAIVGKALYEKRFALSEAIEAVKNAG